MTNPYPFAAVLFDMDGTIVDNVPLHQQVWHEFAHLHGLNPSEAELEFAKGRKAVEVISFLFGTLTPEEVSQLTAERQVLYRQRLAESQTVRTIPGVEKFLTGLGELGVVRVLATSAPFVNVEAVFNKFHLTPYFEAIVTSENVCHGKPDPEIFLTAAQRAGAKPEDCLIAEDSEAGIIAAKAAGATCLGLITTQSKADLQEQGADFVASDFLSLPEPIAL
ncbi:MAG: HAD family phosphatase [Cyanobacteria bacterium CRU_2_1]|nr:HAD family phosphatase [Cyanobacteria bacterium RU_5_0]NJR58765.1 HAD family phosphatase [Cyanobacteria bacterium CRU_2_1]